MAASFTFDMTEPFTNITMADIITADAVRSIRSESMLAAHMNRGNEAYLPISDEEDRELERVSQRLGMTSHTLLSKLIRTVEAEIDLEKLYCLLQVVNHAIESLHVSEDPDAEVPAPSKASINEWGKMKTLLELFLNKGSTKFNIEAATLKDLYARLV